MRIIYYMYFIICFIFIIILGLSLNNNVIKEESYSLKMDYSYIYKDELTMDVVIYSNTLNPRFSIEERNKYYLISRDEEFLVAISVNEITSKKEKDKYRFNVNILVPNFNNIYIDKIYFKASNDYSDDIFYIGSLNIIKDEYSGNIQYKSLSKEVDEYNYLNQISIILDKSVNINELIISKSLNASYEIDDKKIIIYFDSFNYIKELYMVLKCTEGEIKFVNINVNNSNLSFNGNEQFMSLFERIDYND